MAAASAEENARALEQCERDLDSTIERLLNLRLDPASDGEAGPGAAPDGIGNEAHLAAVEAESALTVPSGGGGGGGGGGRAEWVERLVREMASAEDMDDARARAAGVLEAFEGSLAAAAASTSCAVAAKLDVAVWQNGVLKKAVLVQHRLHRAQEEANRELRRQVAGCQERVRRLESDNYALSMHLRQAQQQGSSMAGRFHPEVF
ncbi:hypothetical protein ACP70R_037210 [Stipagrostis hirtigluma subsp. patula]